MLHGEQAIPYVNKLFYLSLAVKYMSKIINFYGAFVHNNNNFGRVELSRYVFQGTFVDKNLNTNKKAPEN